MNSISCNVQFIKKTQYVIYLSPSLKRKLQLSPRLSVYFGQSHVDDVMVRSNSTLNGDTIEISTALKRKLHLPYKKNIMVKPEGMGIRLGPIIGILTTDPSGKIFSSISRPRSKFFRTLLMPEAKTSAFYCVITPDRVNWKNNTAKGLFYLPNESNPWKAITVPLPDVIYNRIPNRSTEKKAMVTQFKQQYKRNGGILYNSGFFSKWEMHRLLNGDPRVDQFLPETYSAPSVATITKMLKKYPFVYLKPIEGSLGLGIYKISRDGEKYTVAYRQGNFNRITTHQNVETIYRSVFKNKKRIKHYLVQQGIALVKHADRQVDFRVHLHKDGNNQWKVVAIGAKQAGKGSVTTHVRTGGHILNTRDFLNKLFKSRASQVHQSIQQASIEVAQVVEEKLGEPIGELGLDVGIDDHNRIWLFEVNAKPGRSIFKTPYLKTASYESAKSLLDYSIYLAGF